MSQRSGDEPRQSKLADGGPCPHDANYQWSTVQGPCRGRLRAVGDGTYRCDGCRVTWIAHLLAAAAEQEIDRPL